MTELLLADIDRETVNFQPTYDGQEKEPEVLPCAFPNLLVNGSSGIAVGMATNIPPHNLGEVVDALVVLIENPDAELDALMEKLPGPDFPTGGYILGREGILEAYRTGRGRLVMRARMRTEQLKGGKEAIVINEIPFQVNKARLVEEIADLVRTKRVQGMTDLRDESDRDGVRIVIELRKGENAQVVINKLYKHTRVQDTFGVIFLAIVNGRPRYLSLLKMLKHFVEHRHEVVVRRTRYDLYKAERRLHIVEGLKIAVDHIDAVIKLIRRSKSVEEARDGLKKTYKLTQEQANAILDMRLQKLTGLEIDKLEVERQGLTKLVKELRTILKNPQKVLAIIKRELLEMKTKYGDARRTEIIEAAKDFAIEDLIAEEGMVITVSHLGYIKRTPISLYRSQRRGGKGVHGMETKEEDWVENLFVGTTHNYILFFTNLGRAYWLKVYELPQAGRMSKGRPIVNLLKLGEKEVVEAMIPVKRFDDEHFLIMATRKGMVVKNALSLYSRPRVTGIKAIKIAQGDELIDVKMTNGMQEIFIGTKKGMAIRFHETDLRPMGRDVMGVRGIRLGKRDEVVGMEVMRPNSTILTVCEKGYGKRTGIEQYRLIRRGGKGVINIRVPERNGDVISVKEVFDDDELIMITQKGMAIRTAVSSLRIISRNTQGVRLIHLKPGDKLTSVARVEEKREVKLEEQDVATAEGNQELAGEEDSGKALESPEEK